MEINYKSQVTFGIIKEIYDIYINRHLIQKNKKYRINISLITLFITIIWFISTLFLVFLNYLDTTSYYVSISLNILEILYIVFIFYFLIIFFTFLKFRKCESGIFKINKNGLSDSEYDDSIITVSKDNVQGIVIGRKCIVVLTNSNKYFHYPLKYKNEIINAIQREIPDIKVFNY